MLERKQVIKLVQSRTDYYELGRNAGYYQHLGWGEPIEITFPTVNDVTEYKKGINVGIKMAEDLLACTIKFAS
jgi:hypothetical protein